MAIQHRKTRTVENVRSRGGWVNSQLFEHTSTIKFLETGQSSYTDPLMGGVSQI